MWLILSSISYSDSSRAEILPTEQITVPPAFPMCVDTLHLYGQCLLLYEYCSPRNPNFRGTLANWMQFKQSVKNIVFFKKLLDPCMILWRKFEKFSLLSSLQGRSTEVIKYEILLTNEILIFPGKSDGQRLSRNFLKNLFESDLHIDRL